MKNVKRIICVILVFFSLAALCGCQPNVSGTSIPFTEEKKQEINEAWKALHGHGLTWEGLAGCVYYGTYGDSIIFLQMGQLTSITTKEIAGQEFIYGSSFSLWVYRDDSFMYLEDAYKDGYITKSQIKELAKYHKSLYEMYYDELNS